jgi:hypothetical protein
LKKIISFSLYGTHPKYTNGMICNVELAKIIYPDWICRIYYDDSVPELVIKTLKEYDNTELVLMSGDDVFPMIWRFLAIDDEDVEVMLCRDADSRLSYREKVCVDIFLSSDSILHSIRDNFNHTNIMGGMWGIKKNNRVKIKNLITNDICKNYDCDQFFLRYKVVPLFLNSYLIHCSYYLNNFPIPKENDYFVGGWWYEDNFGKPFNHIFF